jgi:hypothetical protein
MIDELMENKAAITEALRKKGQFVLDTNHLIETQQNVEGGFRFLKDPWFMLDLFFVKTREKLKP